MNNIFDGYITAVNDYFAYRISLAWRMFGLAAVTALLIALLTVSFQAVKAAISNPVKSLWMK